MDARTLSRLQNFRFTSGILMVQGGKFGDCISDSRGIYASSMMGSIHNKKPFMV